ncbi:hypothetical protein Syun_018551 [Stephania yunnanensis]|uniref:Secreted protein n=1 Tax=Stephania yunnanensis TaxID=152371 RepID=A0AAP0ISK6_9MAGN
MMMMVWMTSISVVPPASILATGGVSHERFPDSDHAGSSRATPNKGKEVKIGNGRRAKRAMKHEAADKAAATAAATAAITASKG